MQFALGSVLKLTRSAFGGLGSFRAPSIRRAFPVLLGGLLFTAVSPAMAQEDAGEITKIAFVSNPTGGPADSPRTVYIIGDPIIVEVSYSENLPASIPENTLSITVGSENKTATCGVASDARSKLLCSYVVAEGDQADAGTGTEITEGGAALQGAGLPSYDYGDVTPTDTRAVDGVRPSLQVSTGATTDVRAGFKAKDEINLILTFIDTGPGGVNVRNAGGFGVAIVLENAERSTKVGAATTTTRAFSYTVVAGDNAKALSLKLSNPDALRDVNGNRGLAASVRVNESFAPNATRRVDTVGPTVTQIRVENDPNTFRATVGGESEGSSRRAVGFVVEFNERVTASNVSLVVLIGSETRPANCDPLTDLAFAMECTLSIEPGWLDTDGLATPTNPLRFGEGAIADDLGNTASPTFRAQRFPEHKVDAVNPTITSATLTVPAARRGNNVVVKLGFSEPIKVTNDAVRVALSPRVTRASVALSIEEGGVGTAASYVKSSGRQVEFRYTLRLTDVDVDDGDEDVCGGDNKCDIELGDATLTGITDVVGNPVVNSSYPEGTTLTKTLTLVQDPWRNPALLRVESVILWDPPDSGRYNKDDTITIAALFSKQVVINGDVSLKLQIGSNDVTAPLETNNENNKAFWRARYPIEDGDNGNIRVTELDLRAGGNIIDANGRGWTATRDDTNTPNLTTTAFVPVSLSGTNAVVDSTRPEITAVKLLSSPAPSVVGSDGARYYGLGHTIRVEVTMSEDVEVDGTGPTLTIALDEGGTATATFEDMSGNRKLIFEYEVEAGHRDRSGVEVSEIMNHASIRDLAGNACEEGCGFDAWAGTVSASHLVDSSLRGVQEVRPITEPPAGDTVNPVGTPRIASTTPEGGYYESGDTIRIEVPLDPAVTFTSTPQLLLNLDEGGSQRLDAEGTFSSSGTARTSLTFNYRVGSGDEDVNGFTGTLSGGGTLTVADGRQVTFGSVTISSAVKIDARVPQVDSIAITSSAGADGTYVAGNIIEVTVRFSEDVRRQGTTDPRLPIVVGSAARTALLQSPAATAAATDTWLFRYVVVAGDNDANGVAIAANALVAALEDAADNAVIVTHAAVAASTAHRVDTQGPSVTGVAIGGDDSGLFREGSTITATVRFDEEVDVVTSGANAVNVRFLVGSMERTAAYASGDGTTALTFTYAVTAGDSGPLSVPANAIVGDVEDAAGNPARGNTAIPVTSYRVDAAAPMLVGISISSRPASGDAYAEGETIRLQVSFDEAVVVDGAPRLPMVVGSRTRNRVLYTGGSGTPALTFSYVVLAGDMDDNGVSVPANSLRLTSGATIKDVNGLSVASESGTVAHGALPDQPGHKVDAVAPDIESLAITSRPNSGDAYLIDEVIEVTVRFSESVSVSGSPMLGLMVGTGSRNASCAQGSDMAAIVCSYAVVANDFDEDGVSVNADALSGTITDVPGNAAILTHPGLDDDPDHKVYAARPEVAASIPDLTLMAGGAGDTLDLTRIFTGFQLSYSAMSSDTSVAAASVSGTTLTVRSGAEGTATVTVTATNLAGLAETTFGVTVRTDPVETTVLNDALAAVGRSMLSSTANVIGARFNLVATSAQMALGGNRFGGSLSPRMQRLFSGNDPFAMRERMGERALFSGGAGSAGHAGGHGVTADRLLTGTSFNMPLNAMGMGDAQFAIWGAGDLQSFEGEPDNGMYDGSASAGFIGVDARGAGWLAGVSISRSGAEADYDFDGVVQGGGTEGTLETAVTAFHPYARLEVGSDSEIWVIGGFGGGEADLSRRHVADWQTRSSDLAMAMAVGGLRRALAMEFGGADLSLRGDAGFLSLETDSGMNAVDGLSASVSRLRLGLEAAWKLESVSPFVEVSGRFDGGDGQTGGGLELAGGLRLLGLVSGFGLEAKGRILAVHTGDGYGESGISVTASFEPGTMGRGIAFRLSPRWGGSADATDLFWDEVGSVREASQHGYGFDRRQTWGVDAALGYGFSLRSMPGIVTPFSQVDMTGDQDQRIRIGVRYGLMQGLLGGTQVELSAERVDGEMHRVGETRVLVSGRARF